jgi:superoxide reductase
MAQKKEVYRCESCGNVIMVLTSGEGELSCCGNPMVLVEEKRDGQGKEKHLPVVNKEGDYIRVKVGEVRHPMGEEHQISWILLQKDEESIVKYLSYDDNPDAKFLSDGVNSVKAYCNLHGLWVQKI